MIVIKLVHPKSIVDLVLRLRKVGEVTHHLSEICMVRSTNCGTMLLVGHSQSCQGQGMIKSEINYNGCGNGRGNRNVARSLASNSH